MTIAHVQADRQQIIIIALESSKQLFYPQNLTLPEDKMSIYMLQ